MGCRVTLLLGWLVALHARPAAAQEEAAKLTCLHRHEDAQVARHRGQLLAARASLLACSHADCPDAVRADCVDWLEEVNRSIPSIVIGARDRGADVTEVKVFLDGELVAARLTGGALEADPGEHHLRLELGRGPQMQRMVVMSEGVKNRPIDVEFAPPPAAVVSAPAGPPPTWLESHPFERSDRIFGGVALAGVATAAAFGIWALVERSDLEGSCAPFCSDDDVRSVRTKLVIADVGLGVAVAALAVGGFRYFTRPASPPGTDVKLVAGASGYALLVRRAF